MMNRTRFVTFALTIVGTLVVTAGSSVSSRADDDVKSIDTLYQKELKEIEARRLTRLAALAEKQAPDAAKQTYEVYFRGAITANLFTEAESIADKVIASPTSGSRVVMLADLVKVMALVSRGEYEQSLTVLLTFLGAPSAPTGKPPTELLALGDKLILLDAYFQRLTQANQFKIATKAFTAFRDKTSDPDVKAFVTSRLARLELVGKPAPAIAGTDLDGRPVRLADTRGQAVLVVFWASWCVNNAEEVARLDAAYTAYRERGFRIIGISLDALDESLKSPGAAQSAAKHFVLDHNLRWPNLLSGTGNQDFAKAYAVSEVPSNVLIGKDGTIIGLDLTAANLDKSVAAAVGP